MEIIKTCSVCNHPKRDAIEKCLVNGDSYRDVEKIYGISKSALHRHKTEHLTLYSPAVAANPAVVANSDDLLGQLKDLITRTLAALDRAESSGDDRMFLLAVREARSNTELAMKVQLYLADRAVKDAPPEGHKVVFVYPQLQERPEVALTRLAELLKSRALSGQATDLQAMDEAARKDFLEHLLGPVRQLIEPSEGVQISLPDNGRGPSVWRQELKDKINRIAERQPETNSNTSQNQDIATEKNQTIQQITVEAPATPNDNTNGIIRDKSFDKTDNKGGRVFVSSYRG